MNKQKSIIITGGNRGIGAAIAQHFAEKQFNIAIVTRSGSSEEHINALKSKGVDVLDITGDISDFNFTQDTIKQVKEAFGTIDVLVNNAGINRDMLMMRMKEEDFDAVIDINLKGTFNMMKHVSKIMLKQKSGSIINIASIVAETGNIGQINYAASKAGIIGMTKTAARELASRGITVNAIAPGYIATDMTGELSDKVTEAMLTTIPLARFGEAEEVAHAAYFLSENHYITGATLDINGGMAMN